MERPWAGAREVFGKDSSVAAQNHARSEAETQAPEHNNKSASRPRSTDNHDKTEARRADPLVAIRAG